MFWSGFYDVAVEAERCPAYAAYLRSALANPDIVGVHWFQHADEPLPGRLLDGENGHIMRGPRVRAELILGPRKKSADPGAHPSAAVSKDTGG